ncbi:MAG: alpha-glucosidase family protein [Gammaproteobacteria bacterium]|nr:alpha-glucosidase family protein [Gammaproteobacteria bacterium]
MTQTSDKREWWRGATIYQVYPRSFLDTTGNGIGDLPGITRRLGYIRDLGVDAIWLSPFFKSPMRDFGYDVSDFCDVDPLFGTLRDFDELLSAADKLGLRIIIDQVYSHSSTDHAWFMESASDRANARADWYVWADPRDDGKEPNNWQSIFGGPSWSWSDSRQQYYLHNFLSEQPDLNLHNEEVRQALFDVARFWLDRGVKGFRLDALHCLMHDPELRDNPDRMEIPANAHKPYHRQEHVFDHAHPDVPAFLEHIRKLTDEYDGIFTVAEVGTWKPLPLMREYTQPRRLNSAYGFDFLAAPKLDATEFRKAVEAWPNGPDRGWPSWAFSNHDAPRVATRWGGSSPGDDRTRLIALLQFSLRGNVFLYQGEELGLAQAEIPFERLVDPEAIASWPHTMGRDGARTPMPWNKGEKNAGFSTAEPWLPIDSTHVPRAVNQQADDPDSVLSFFRRVVQFRKQNPALVTGDLVFLPSPSDTLLFLRTNGKQRVLCAFNLSDSTREFDVEAPHGFDIGLAVGRLTMNSGDRQFSIASGGGFIAPQRST